MALSDEEIARLLKKAQRPESKRRFSGYSASTFEKDGKLVMGYEPNKNPRAGGKGKIHNPGPVQVPVDWDLPDIKKRTGPQRVDSLMAKLAEAAKDPVQLNFLLQRVQGEFWKKGRTVAMEDIRKLAQELLAKAEAEAKEKARKTF